MHATNFRNQEFENARIRSLKSDNVNGPYDHKSGFSNTIVFLLISRMIYICECAEYMGIALIDRDFGD